ncbi:hypothetical protein JL720_12493 [Aureococcus anophagefferens]|nr:hypothetical protein JL720_12493 [Aureococcus anophagefferens]
MSDWISVTNTPKKKDQAEEADQQAPLSKAQQKNKKRAEKRRERVEVLKGLAWNEDDEALAAAAQHELLQRTKPPDARGLARGAAAVAAGNADKDLVAKAGRRAALEADEKAARRAVEDGR